jgi:uncharacterized protein (TIGR02588 family)
MSKRRASASKRKAGVEKNWLEWSVFGVGLALVACVLGFLVYDGARMGEAPPDIELRLGAPERRGAVFVVPVAATNRGDETAEGVQIEVVLETGGGGEPERGEFAIAFLPRRATRNGWVTFRTDPGAGQLKARVLGYEKP